MERNRGRAAAARQLARREAAVEDGQLTSFEGGRSFGGCARACRRHGGGKPERYS
jgi:hypothetical protein